MRESRTLRLSRRGVEAVPPPAIRYIFTSSVMGDAIAPR